MRYIYKPPIKKSVSNSTVSGDYRGQCKVSQRRHNADELRSAFLVACMSTVTLVNGFAGLLDEMRELFDLNRAMIALVGETMWVLLQVLRMLYRIFNP